MKKTYLKPEARLKELALEVNFLVSGSGEDLQPVDFDPWEE